MSISEGVNRDWMPIVRDPIGALLNIREDGQDCL